MIISMFSNTHGSGKWLFRKGNPFGRQDEKKVNSFSRTANDEKLIFVFENKVTRLELMNVLVSFQGHHFRVKEFPERNKFLT